ncbi:hypothetical protein [Halomicrobium salinisoli]|uniref:hypothetical protein n=1 Tax=Halomicrobium salinisoli TaxID=2878391 RepID=UPI001CEFC89C|nr:hypothetical protein [Halomicrobium salinisoli]
MVDRGERGGGDQSRQRAGPTFTRRRALELAGAAVATGTVGTAASQTPVAARITETGDEYTLSGIDGSYRSSDLASAIDFALGRLSPGRSSRERIVVDASGRVSERITLPSNVALEFNGTITADGVIPLYADRAESITIRGYDLEGSPAMGMRIRRADDVVIDDVTMDVDSGIGIRIDDGYNDGTPETTTNVEIGTVEVAGTGSHGVETYGVEGIDVGTVRTTDTGGCGLLLNNTADATIERVDATRADEGGGYAGFRCANDAGPNVTVERVDAVACGRGVFTVSGSEGITIEEVHLEDNGGNLIQDSRDVTIGGGAIVGTGGSGVRIDSRSSEDHPHTRNVTVENVEIRESGAWGVRETGPGTESNAIRNNAFCDNASGAVDVYADSTTVSGNSYECSDDPDGGTCEPTPIDPYLRVDGGEWQNAGEATVDAGAQVEFGPQPTEGGSWSWSGPRLSASSREVTVSPDETATYTATYTNDCGETSTYEFAVTVERDSGRRWPEGATDPDDDGLYEDINGNGEVDYSDVVDYFENMEELQDQVEYFDYNGNGEIDYADLVDLFQQV